MAKATTVFASPPGPADFAARLAVAPKHGKHGLRGVTMPPLNGRGVLVWVFDDAMPSTGSPTGLFWEPNIAACVMLLHEHSSVAGEVAPEKRPLILTVRESRAEAEYNALVAELQRRAIPSGKPSAWILDEFDDDGKRTRGLRVSFLLILDDANDAPRRR